MNVITCNSFGWRLGNQLFQYATMFAYSVRKNKTILLDKSHQDQHIFKCFDIKNLIFDSYNPRKIHKEKIFSFVDFFDGDYDCINGYFQSEKYFFEIKSELNDVLKFKAYGKNYSNYCSIHVRRGDYLNYPLIHPICDNSYYELAIENIKKINGNDIKFVVFSDDIEYCKNNYPCFKQNNIIFDENTSTYESLYSLSTCDFSIIANSSFSWWGAWLKNKQTIISPKKWFGPQGPQETKDIYCKDWIIL
jgi:hypothetical protein